MAPDARSWLREVPAVEVLRRVWVQTFTLDEGDGTASRAERSVVRWRTQAEGFPPSLLMVASPYDPDVHYVKKRATTAWIGYKVHLTETCDDERPPLVTHVATTPAPVVDRATLAPVHAALAEKGLLPSRHLVDAGYLDADQLVASARDHGVALIGPAPRDNHWQGRTSGAFMLEDFVLDWDRRVATCPEGRTSRSWSDERDLGRTTMRVRFSTDGLQGVPVQAALHARRPSAAHPAAAPRARDPRGGTGAREGAGVRRRPASACRCRGHPLARGARHGFASLSLHRHGQNASSAFRHRGRDQPHAPRRLGGGHPYGSNQALRIRPPHEQPRSPRLRHSPAVSQMGHDQWRPPSYQWPRVCAERQVSKLVTATLAARAAAKAAVGPNGPMVTAMMSEKAARLATPSMTA